MKLGRKSKRLILVFVFVAACVSASWYLGTTLPARAQETEFHGDYVGLAPGFEPYIPPVGPIPEGMVMLNDQYVYVMKGNTLYQFRHDRFPEGVHQFTFGSEPPQPPQPPQPMPMRPAPSQPRSSGTYTPTPSY